MGCRAETLPQQLQSPASRRSSVSCFPKWSNHAVLLPGGLGVSLADKPGLGASLSCSPGALLCCSLQGRPLQLGYGATTPDAEHENAAPGLAHAHPMVGHRSSVPPAQPGLPGLTHNRHRVAEAGPASRHKHIPPRSSHFLLQLKNNLMASV